MYGDPDPFVLVIILVLAAVSLLKDRAEAYLEPDPLEQAKREYAREEISEAEFHRRLELHLDERNDRIRTAVEEIDGIGPATSEPIALRFDSLDDLADADREELEKVHGIGESTATAIHQHLQRAQE
jgi:ERCC4-type nuclease